MTTPTLSAAVMAHPARAAMVDELLAALDRPTPVVWDQRNDRHDTGLRTIKAYDPDCSHHLVIQDDVVPCRDLLAGAERALRWIPQDVPISLYIGRVRPFSQAVESVTRRAGDDASWITMAGIYWGPAVILPTTLIEQLAAGYATDRITNHDRRMSRWFANRGTRCWYAWPSLVEHRGDESLAHRGARTERRAHRFIGADMSALAVDWSGPVLEMANTERLDRSRQSRARQAAVA